jgi:hypothetical protein
VRAFDSTRSSHVFVTGYRQAGDGGGGHYYVDTADTGSADNGGTVIAAGDGARWKLIHQGAVSIKQFGARVDGTTDDHAFSRPRWTPSIMCTSRLAHARSVRPWSYGPTPVFETVGTARLTARAHDVTSRSTS